MIILSFMCEVIFLSFCYQETPISFTPSSVNATCSTSWPTYPATRRPSPKLWPSEGARQPQRHPQTTLCLPPWRGHYLQLMQSQGLSKPLFLLLQVHNIPYSIDISFAVVSSWANFLERNGSSKKLQEYHKVSSLV